MNNSIPTPQAYTFNAPAGVPGGITRVDNSVVEPAMLTNPATAFGIPLKYDTGGVTPFAGGETAADFAALLIREVPSISGNNNQNLFDNVPNQDAVQGIMPRGYASVICTVGTPARGGTVYVRVVAAMGKAIGDFEASSDGSNSVALSKDQASWAVDGKDATGITEIKIAK